MTFFTAELMQSLIDYDPETGIATWKERPQDLFYTYRAYRIWNSSNAGKNAGYLDTLPNGYKRYKLDVKIKGNQLYTKLHRVVWAIHYGEWPEGQIDHINGDACDNRIENLRDTDSLANNRNRAISSANTSGYTGVSELRGKYQAGITVGGKFIYLGLYSDKEDAIAARKKAEIEYGFHENHGRKKAYAESE